jgi:hypothetical protein
LAAGAYKNFRLKIYLLTVAGSLRRGNTKSH